MTEEQIKLAVLEAGMNNLTEVIKAMRTDLNLFMETIHKEINNLTERTRVEEIHSSVIDNKITNNEMQIERERLERMEHQNSNIKQLDQLEKSLIALQHPVKILVWSMTILVPFLVITVSGFIWLLLSGQAEIIFIK